MFFANEVFKNKLQWRDMTGIYSCSFQNFQALFFRYMPLTICPLTNCELLYATVWGREIQKTNFCEEDIR